MAKAATQPAPSGLDPAAEVDRIDQLRAQIGAGDYWRVYRLDRENPSDPNGKYLGRIPADEPDLLEAIAGQYGGGRYRAQMVDVARNVIRGHVSPIEIDGAPRQRLSPPPPTPTPLTPAAATPPAWGSGGPAAAAGGALTVQDLAAAMQAQTRELITGLAQAIGSANKPRTIGEMTDSELVALLGRAMGATQQPGIQAPTWPQVFELLPKFAGMMSGFGPRSGFEEGLQAWQAIERLRGVAGGGDGEKPATGTIDALVGLLREDPLIRKGLELALTRFAAGESEQKRRPVPNEAGAAPQVAAGTPAAATGNAAPAAKPGAELPPAIAGQIPLVASMLRQALTEDPKLRASDAARGILDAAPVADLAALLPTIPDGRLAAAILAAEPALKPASTWIVMLEGSIRSLVEETIADAAAAEYAGDADQDGADDQDDQGDNDKPATSVAKGAA